MDICETLNCDFSNLPSQYSPQLKYFSCVGCDIDKLPELDNLKSLNCSFTNVKEIPNSYSKLSQLTCNYDVDIDEDVKKNLEKLNEYEDYYCGEKYFIKEYYEKDYVKWSKMKLRMINDFIKEGKINIDDIKEEINMIV